MRNEGEKASAKTLEILRVRLMAGAVWAAAWDLVPAPRGASVWDFAAPQRGGVRLYPLLPAEDVRRNER